MRLNLILCFVVTGLPAVARAQEPSWEAEFAIAYETAYVSEGRDNLGEGGLAHISASLGYAFATAEVWLARGLDEDYTEVNLGLCAEYSVGLLTLEGGYTRLEFTESEDFDNELDITAALALPLGLELFGNAVLSTEAEGYFIDAGLSGEWEARDSGVTFAPYALIAWDLGYASPEYDGLNHFETGLAVSWAFAEGLTATIYGAVTIELEDIEREDGGDQAWAGIALSYALP